MSVAGCVRAVFNGQLHDGAIGGEEGSHISSLVLCSMEKLGYHHRAIMPGLLCAIELGRRTPH